MVSNNIFRPDYMFEVSWEICNKVGGIYTVLATKSKQLSKVFGDTHIYIGPDVWMETTNTPAFKDDNGLYKSWADVAHGKGLQFRIGRWLVPGSPIVILVDFKQYFSQRNEIFTEYWEKYKLDSISGQWDYVEPAMFGYAAAKIIESFYEYHVSSTDVIEAQFHEWMSGMGILYLKDKVPQIGTIFTTHATFFGRCIAGNGMQLYSNIHNFNTDEIASQFNIRAKCSLERLSVQLCDIFTTVSEITSKEAQAFYDRPADVITPNGFVRDYAATMKDANKKRQISRKIIFSVANALLNTQLDEEMPIIITSGRYEFKNKGLDIFISSLGQLNEKSNQDVLVLICVPANAIGPVTNLRETLNGNKQTLKNKYLTHEIHNPDNDAVITSLKEHKLLNEVDDKVKVMFVPVYLNGNDGIFDISYYDLLAGCDLSVFPSYYEPFGYTPLESLAMGVPTITSSLAGFGNYLLLVDKEEKNVATVLYRSDNNYEQASESLCDNMLTFTALDKDTKEQNREKAFELSSNFLWENLISKYYDSYIQASYKSLKREAEYKHKKRDLRQKIDSIVASSEPIWRKAFVKQWLPEILQPLRELSMNLWWSWNKRAENLFQRVSPTKWEQAEKNPITLLELLTDNDLANLEHDVDFMSELKSVHGEFVAYMSEKSTNKNDLIAYFSMEYGLHNSLKIYSGGLGILAGDYLKEMSDDNVNAVAIGLLYRYGYFVQNITPEGNQTATDVPQKFTHLPIIPVRNENGSWLEIKIAMPARNITAKVWRVDVGRVELYLLDTDIDINRDDDRKVTYHLYGGDWENRLKQELLLGIGGIRALRALKLSPMIYHLNEGHAAFAGLERLRELVEKKNFTFEEAVEMVRASTLFTTHTPVPAGHDTFAEDMIRTYLPNYPDLLRCSWDTMVNLGKMHPNDVNERFSMSVLAINTSVEVNGVSKIHGAVTREMFMDMYKGYYSDELFIGHVTNGVHYPTWASEEWQKIHKHYLGDEFLKEQSNDIFWKKIYDVPDKEIWNVRNLLRKRLIDHLRQRLHVEMTGRQESPKHILHTLETLSDKKLTIGFARRFATYKRAHLLFQNIDRLDAIVNSQEHPVQFIFAGKAHPADKAGQDLIKNIIDISRLDKFAGKIVFVENYDMELAKLLVQGVDVWLNTPTRPLEASGTSGEKAAMNGVLNLSVLDGWWAEGYKPQAGWQLPQERAYDNQNIQDILDSETIYTMLENEIAPLFYNVDNNDIPSQWIHHVKNSFYLIAPHFTMKRMLDDYFEKYYTKLFARTKLFKHNNGEQAIKYAEWKRKVADAWNEIEVKRIIVPDPSIRTYKVGETFEIDVELKINELNIDDIAVDLIIGSRDENFKSSHHQIYSMKPDEKVNGKVTYSLKETIHTPGVIDYAIRIRPTHDLMPYMMDVKTLKWI